MENLPQIGRRDRLPVDITVHPYLLDHRFEDKVVFPAVEAMQVLAETVGRFLPGTDTTRMLDARFDKFLHILPGTSRISAFIDVSVNEDGDVSAILLTREKAKKTSMTRIREHALVRFPAEAPDIPEPPLDLASCLGGVCIEIPAGDVYRDLVPFGPSYHNILDPLYISLEGAVARTYASPLPGGPDVRIPLGSSFPLDASFHAACAWAQRYSGIVAFPVGIERRCIFNRTEPGRTYFSRIVPTGRTRDMLLFDIWIHDEGGTPFECARGVQMKDVSAGRMKPPQWIADDGGEDLPEPIRRRCLAISLIELKTLRPFAEKALSAPEKIRLHRMADRRRRSYLAARLACKGLSRVLSGNDSRTAAPRITTLCDDLVHPCCPYTDGAGQVPCSVSHDDRFALAVASDDRVGVDVERVSGRVLKSVRLYADGSEQDLIRESDMGSPQAAIRIWSIKEAAAKAMDIPLADSWNRVRVRAIDRHESSFQIDGKGSYTAFHAVLGQHVVTLACGLGDL